jgi:hypothetical protein
MSNLLLSAILTLLCLSSIFGRTFYTALSDADSVYIRALDYYDESEDSSTIIEITYPKIHGLRSKAAEEKINLYLEEEFFKSIEWFDEFIAILDSLPTLEYERGMFFSFETGFDIKLLNQKVLSLALNHYEFTGGAHGNFYAIGYTFGLNDGELLTLDKIIKSDSLPALTKICEQRILEMFEAESLSDAGMFDDYIDLTFDQDFFLTSDALVFQFDPYEIAPYSMGNIEVVIPIDEIKDHLLIDLNEKE